MPWADAAAKGQLHPQTAPRTSGITLALTGRGEADSLEKLFERCGAKLRPQTKR